MSAPKTKVYIVVDDCPLEHGEPSILAVYSNKRNAAKYIATLQKRDAYLYQYCEIVSRRVRTENAKRI